MRQKKSWILIRKIKFSKHTIDMYTTYPNIVEEIPTFADDEQHHVGALAKARRFDAQAPSKKRPFISHASRVLDMLGPSGSSPLVAACTTGDVDLVVELLALGANPCLPALVFQGKGKKGKGVALKHTCFACNDTNTVGIRDGVVDGVNKCSESTTSHMTPLMAASRFGHGTVVRKLLSSIERTLLQEQVNQAHPRSGVTLLFVACCKGNTDVVEALVESGVLNTNLIGTSEESNGYDSGEDEMVVKVSDVPLRAACMSRSVEIVKLLLGDPETDVNLVVKRAAFPNGAESSLHWEKLRDTEGSSTALGEACSEINEDLGSSASVEIVKLLLAAPQVQYDFPQLLDTGARTPLQILCESNARVHSHRDWGTVGSPDYLHSERNKAKIATMLINAGASMRVSSKFNLWYDRRFPGAEGEWSLLHQACVTCNTSVAEVLIAHGADVNGYSIETQESGLPGVTPLLAVLTNGNEVRNLSLETRGHCCGV